MVRLNALHQLLIGEEASLEFGRDDYGTEQQRAVTFLLDQVAPA